MAISAQSIEPTANQGQCISDPVRHEVTIVGWDYLDYGEGQDVVFELSDDEGARMFLRFGLSDLELRSGQLNRFLATVLQRQPPEPEGIPPHIIRQMWFNQTVGRKVLLVVAVTSRGVRFAIDWEAVPQG